MKKYYLEDSEGCLWCHSGRSSYWSKIGDYKKQAVKYNIIMGKIQVLIISLFTDLKVNLVKIKGE